MLLFVVEFVISIDSSWFGPWLWADRLVGSNWMLKELDIVHGPIPWIFFFCVCVMEWHCWELVGTRRWGLVAEWIIWDIPGKMSLVPCAFLSVSKLLWSERLCRNSPCQSVCLTVGSRIWPEISKSLSQNEPFLFQVYALRCLSRQHRSVCVSFLLL